MDNTNKSKFLTFIFSFLPGLGHMYIGLLNRGLQIMILFFGSMFLMDFINLNAFPFFIPIIWFFNMFDSLQFVAKMRRGEEVPDELLVEWSSITTKSKAWGWGLVVIGAYILLERVIFQIQPLRTVMSYVFGYQGIDVIRNILIAIILIYIGWKLLSGKSILPKSNSDLEGEQQ